jgi:hypothetical protein
LDKAVTLRLLSDAKKGHVSWVHRAQLLIDGLPIDKDAVPLSCRDCEFGQWFYEHGQKLSVLGNVPYLNEIEKVHFDTHDQYMKIYRIYFAKNSRSLLSKLLSSKKKISDEDKELAKEHFKKLQIASNQLLNLISKLEYRLSAIPESNFNTNENKTES